jgi:hypothetical protein
MIALEYVGDGNTGVRVFVRTPSPGAVIEVGVRPSQVRKELLERIGVLQGVNQQCLLPVAQELRGDARPFFNSSLAFFNRSCSSCKRRTTPLVPVELRSSCALLGH